MLYFKNIELAEKYHISLGTVRNWIEATQAGKMDIALYMHEGRPYVANTTSNISMIERLAESRKKYRNTRAVKTVSPKPEFYNLYTRRQALDIISNLTIHQEIDPKYDYMGQGAVNWDDYSKRQEKEEGANLLNSTIELIQTNLPAIEDHLKGYKRVNLIDLGPGNGRPSKELVEHMMNRGVLHRYIAVDISQSMLDIVEQNFKDWFGDKVKFEGYVRDLSFERFDDLLVDDMLDHEANQTLNLVMLLGGTAANFPSFADAIKVVYGSMGANDLLMHTGMPDTEYSRRYFDFSPEPDSSTLSPIDRFKLDLLNIDTTIYEVEMGYDEQAWKRSVNVRLKTALTIKFQFEDGERCVYLEKGHSILLYRSWHLTTIGIISEFERSGFTLLQAGTTKDREYLMTLSGVDKKRIS